jgi:hypothetical protein
MSSTVELDHIVYSLVPYKGYAVRAWSKKEAVYNAERAFKGWFSPYEQFIVRPGAELRAVVKGFGGYIYVARVFVGEGLDELKRSGVVSHIALVPLDIAVEKRLSLEEVDKAMANYTVLKGIELDEIEPLRISFGGKDRDEDIEYLKTVVDVENARKLLTAISQPESKTIVIFKRDPWSRARLAYGLAKMLAIHKVAEYIVTVEKPIDNILIEFTKVVMILDKMLPLRRTENWTVVKITGEGGKIETEAEIEETLRRLGYKTGSQPPVK